jgi:hypothetical protein
MQDTTTIISFEGPPAVGKTTTSAYLSRHHNALVIPEVNRLFARPDHEADDWYFHRQIARWEMALRSDDHNRLIVLDGDPFQPLWFNWIFAHEPWQPLEEVVAFYRPHIEAGHIGFPN